MIQQIHQTLKLIFQTFRDLIIKFLPQKAARFLVKEKGEFAFLVHPRDLSDVQRKYPFAKYLPNWFLELFTRFLWPVVCSQITGLKNKEGKEIKGWIIGFSMLPHQILENRQLAKKRIFQSIKLAEKLGAKIMGLGAFSSSITHEGLDLKDKVRIKLTSGNSYTVAVSVESIEKIVRERNINLNKAQIAIIGATGSIGKNLSKILAKKFPKLILVSRTLEHLHDLAKDIYRLNNKVEIKISTDISSVIDADIIVVATSAIGAIVKKEHLKFGAIVYDVTQPQNVSLDIVKERKDILVIDGGLVKTPGINYHFNLGLPKEVAFACLAETMLLAAENKFNHYFLDEIGQVEGTERLAKKYNFKPVLLCQSK